MQASAPPASRLRAAAGFVAGRLRGRPDREHEVVANRLIISTLLMIYLAISGLLHTMEVRDAVIATAVYWCISLGFLIHMLMRPQTSHARRIVGMFTDIGALTYCLAVGGATTAVLFPIYLWIIFGNGFRFGLRYLFAAMGLGLAGFGLLLAMSPYWSGTGHLGIGLLAGLLVLPAYTSTLIRSLSMAKRQAEEASRAKSLFLASVSHELRTPLNAVIGMGDLLRDSRLDAEQQEMAATISASARSLLSLIEEILSFSRVEAVRMPIQIGDFDLYAMLHQVRAMLAPAAREKGLLLGLHVTPQTPQFVRGDGKHIQEVLINLAGNALKFTQEGHVLIAVDNIGGAEGGSRIRFEVSDTGIGIAPEACGRIFESFTQADESIVNRFGGTGLGLAISKQLVELQGGRIGVDSEVGAGSTFWLELQLERQAHNGERRIAPAEATLVMFAVAADKAAEIRSIAAGRGFDAVETADIEEVRNLLSDARRHRDRKPVVLVDEGSVDRASLLIQDLSSEIVRPAFLLARSGGSEEALPREQRVRFAAALAHPIVEREVLAALDLALAGDLAEQKTISELAGADSSRSLSILVADDNRTNQKVIAKILERGGHRAALVDNGEQAVDALLAGSYDLVLMDINMPVMSGIEATKLYRFAAVGRKRVPIVALTADATPEARARCVEAGMDACVTKPIPAMELFRIIDSLVPRADGAAAPAAGASETVTDLATHPRFRAEGRALDPATIEQLEKLGGEGFVSDLAREFADEGACIIEELKASLADNDYEFFRDRAHALRSGAANIGALPLYQLCLALREISPADFARHGLAKAAQLDEEFARVRRELGARWGGGVGEAPQSGAATAVIRPLNGAALTSAGSAQR